MMRKLKKIKIAFSEKKGTTYALEWGESENGTTWERHALASNDMPRPELEAAIETMELYLIDGCEIMMDANTVHRNVEVTDITYEAKTPEVIKIGGVVILQRSGRPLALHSPWLPLVDDLKEAYTRLEAECMRYIDGDRAQGHLFAGMEEAQCTQS